MTLDLHNPPAHPPCLILWGEGDADRRLMEWLKKVLTAGGEDVGVNLTTLLEAAERVMNAGRVKQ